MHLIVCTCSSNWFITSYMHGSTHEITTCHSIITFDNLDRFMITGLCNDITSFQDRCNALFIVCYQNGTWCLYINTIPITAGACWCRGLSSVVIVCHQLIANIHMDVTGLCSRSQPGCCTLPPIFTCYNTHHASYTQYITSFSSTSSFLIIDISSIMLITYRSVSIKAKCIAFIARFACNVRSGRRKHQHGTTRLNDNHVHAYHYTPYYRKLVADNNYSTIPEAPAMSSSSTDGNKLISMLFRQRGSHTSDLTDNDVTNEIEHLQRLYLLALDEVRRAITIYERRKTRVTTCSCNKHICIVEFCTRFNGVVVLRRGLHYGTWSHSWLHKHLYTTDTEDFKHRFTTSFT